MVISSNTLFHFTKSKDNLMGILENEFQPKYCLEKFGVGDMQTEAAIPMVSFCDIPLSQIKNHIKIYGQYGLGLSTKWAMKKGLNPVFYLRKASTLSKHIESISNYFLDSVPREGEATIEILSVFLDILRYIKPYKGDFYRSAKLIPNVKFYNEREWRYVPKPEDCGFAYILKKENFLNEEKRKHENEKLSAATLSFDPDDIQYIILNSETEIFPMIEALRKIKSPKYDEETIDILTSRIITTQRIINDF